MWNQFLEYTAGWKTKTFAAVIFLVNAYEAIAPSLDLSLLFSTPRQQGLFNLGMATLVWWARNQTAKEDANGL